MLRPAEWPFFYGNVVLVVSSIAQVVGAAGTSTLIAFIIPSILADEALDVSTSTLSILYSGSSLAGVLGAPLLGRLVDRHGARVCLAWGFAIQALSLCLISVSTSLVGLYCSLAVLRGMTLAGLMLWIIVPINHWFFIKRGRAISVL